MPKIIKSEKFNVTITWETNSNNPMHPLTRVWTGPSGKGGLETVREPRTTHHQMLDEINALLEHNKRFGHDWKVEEKHTFEAGDCVIYVDANNNIGLGTVIGEFIDDDKIDRVSIHSFKNGNLSPTRDRVGHIYSTFADDLKKFLHPQ